MYTAEMLESIKKVEATRAQRIGVEPRRMTAEEKDALLKEFHPDYREDGFQEIQVGPNKGEKAPYELGTLLHSNSKVSCIAAALKFRNPAYFCEIFKKHFGATPLQYRHRKQ